MGIRLLALTLSVLASWSAVAQQETPPATQQEAPAASPSTPRLKAPFSAAKSGLLLDGSAEAFRHSKSRCRDPTANFPRNKCKNCFAS